MTTLIDEEWRVLAGLLPEGWEEMARETGAIRRARGAVDSPETLLKLLLLHVAGGLSLKQAVARAHVQGLASLSDVALLKRLRSSEGWLRELSRRMFEASRFGRVAKLAPAGRRVRVTDATTVEEPGATGTDWRVHYCVDLADLHCDFFEVTDVSGSETYERVPVQAGDILLGDRGYCHRKCVAHVLGKGGDVVVRLHSTNFPLRVPGGEKPFRLLPKLRTLRAGSAREWPVCFEAVGRLWNARVCAVKKSAAAAAAAKKKILAAASRRQEGPVRPETLEFAEYVFILVTLDPEELSADAALGLYRARWQIELCFKRLKSLLRLGHLPKTSDASARAWIHGKLLTALLIETLADRARLFSPWGYDLAEAQQVA